MAHWVGVVNTPEKKVFTGKSKQEVINQIAIALTRRSANLANSVERQLYGMKESIAVAYKEEEEIAKTFACNCGSVKKHGG